MQKDDIKQLLKQAKEFEGKGSFILGVIIVLFVFATGLYSLQRLKFVGFHWPKNPQSNTPPLSPTPGLVHLDQLPSAPGQVVLPAEYTVNPGDSTWKVALAVYGLGDNYRDIENANNLK